MHIVAWWLFFVSNQIFFNTKVCYSYFLFCFNDRRYGGEKHLLKKQIKTKKVG